MNNDYSDYLTVTSDGLDVEAHNIEAECITSKNNNFEIDSSGNITCNSITSNTKLTMDFDIIYPVGSIYMSMASTDPSTLFGGTWILLKDAFLVGAGNTYALGSTGGTETHNHTSAAHTHGYGSLYTAINFAGTYGTRYKTKSSVSFTPNERKADSGAGYSYSTSSTEGVQVYGSTASTTPGKTGSSSNIPPYIAVNIWQRTA